MRREGAGEEEAQHLVRTFQLLALRGGGSGRLLPLSGGRGGEGVGAEEGRWVWCTEEGLGAVTPHRRCLLGEVVLQLQWVDAGGGEEGVLLLGTALPQGVGMATTWTPRRLHSSSVRLLSPPPRFSLRSDRPFPWAGAR